jgi:hypothetical protein
MNKNELRDWIDSLTDDIEFLYDGVFGSICPTSRTEISVSYGEYEKTHGSIDSAMSDPFIKGQSLNEISNKIDIQ